MTVFVFGNPDLPLDSLPLRLLPQLKKHFPKIEFITQDPNEEWPIVPDIIIIDTVRNIKNPQVFDNLAQFARSPRYSLHDFDAFTNLLYLKKLGKIKTAIILGLPPHFPEKQALAFIYNQLTLKK